MQEPCACARCAAIYPTCCRTEPEVAHLCFPLSEAEWLRILPYEIQAALPGRVREENSTVFVSAMKRLFPGHKERVEALFPVPGGRYRLGTTPEGACVFLGSEGCRLPRTARPWYCLLFPVWVQNGRFDIFTAEQCLVSKEFRGLAEVLKAVGLTAEEARELSAALHRDWGLL